MMSERAALTDDALLLRTERLELRPLVAGDAAELFPHCSDPELSRQMTWTAHADIAVTEGFVAASVAARARGEDYVWCIREDRAFRGLVGIEGVMRGLAPVRMDRAELGYWIGRPFHGRGLVTEAARAALECAFTTLALHKVTTSVFTTNAASLRVAEKLGFRRIGTRREDVFRDGAWHDQHVFELLAGDRPASC